MGGNSRSKDIINKIEAKFKVLKRAGRNEDFKVDKIKKAIRRALINGGDWPSDSETEVYVDKVANAVCSLIVKANSTNEVSVEDIQKYVIQQFWIDNMDRVATHYTLYKEERRKAREADPIDPEIREMIASDAKHFGEPIQYFQLITKFARWNESKKRRETWQEVCDRVIGWFKKQPKAKSLTKENWDELYNYLYTLKASSTRIPFISLWTRCAVGSIQGIGYTIQGKNTRGTVVDPSCRIGLCLDQVGPIGPINARKTSRQNCSCSNF